MDQSSNKDYLDTCHKCMLELLKYVHKICTENDIKYTLESGTLLGAIREKGFIPWDDDCDISLVREEYEKLKKILKSSTLPEYVGVYSPDEQSHFLDFNLRLYYKKTQIRFDEKSTTQYSGVFSYPTLDIYVMDHMPANLLKHRLFVLWQQITFGLAMSKRISINFEKYKPFERIVIFILSKIGKLFGVRKLCTFHENVSKMYINKNAEKLYCTGWIPEFPGWVYDESTYGMVHLTDFEDSKFYVIDDYETVLDGYGDWRTPVKTHDHTNIIEDL